MVFLGDEPSRRFVARFGFAGIVEIHRHNGDGRRIENLPVDAHPGHQLFAGFIMERNTRFFDLFARSLADNQDFRFLVNLKNRTDTAGRIRRVPFVRF